MARAAMLIDDLLPEYDVYERHERVVDLPPEAAMDAFLHLTLRALPVSWLLFGVRSLPDRIVGRRGLPSSRDAPLVQQFLDFGFTKLAESESSLVVGTIAPVRGLQVEGLGQIDSQLFVAYDVPGYVKIAMEWAFEDHKAGCRVVTETRVLATDDSARSRFGWYWRVIGPFSGLIRREWLGALARERGTAESG